MTTSVKPSTGFQILKNDYQKTIETNYQSLANSESCKASMYRVAAIVSAISAIAITGVLSAVFLGLTTQASLSLSWAITYLVAFCTTMSGVSIFSNWQNESAEKASFNKKIADQLDAIKHWNTDSIQAFYKAEGIPMNQFSNQGFSLLKNKKPQAPLTALLPIIALYLVLKEKSESLNRSAKDQVAGIEAFKTNKEMQKLHTDILNIIQMQSISVNVQLLGYLQMLITLSSTTINTSLLQGQEKHLISNRPIKALSFLFK